MTIFQNRITEIITSDPRLLARLGEYGHRVIELKQHRQVEARADGARLTRCADPGSSGFDFSEDEARRVLASRCYRRRPPPG
jgi:hypothetical protein